VRKPLDLGDAIEIDGVRMRVDEVRCTFGGTVYHLWWLANGDIHEVEMSEEEIEFIRFGDDEEEA